MFLSALFGYFSNVKYYKTGFDEFVYSLDEMLYDLNKETNKINDLMNNNVDAIIIKYRYIKLKNMYNKLELSKKSIIIMRKELYRLQISDINSIQEINEDLTSLYTDIQYAILMKNKIRNYIINI